MLQRPNEGFSKLSPHLCLKEELREKEIRKWQCVAGRLGSLGIRHFHREAALSSFFLCSLTGSCISPVQCLPLLTLTRRIA